MLLLELKEILQDQVHIFQVTHYESFQIHELTIRCYFKQIIYDILLILLFQIL